MAPCYGPCGRSYGLLVMTPKGDYCPPCWYARGRPEPFPRFRNQWEADNAIRAAMTARGSTGRHMVRNGRT